MLDFLLDLGIIRIQTCLMRDCDYAMIKEYIALECTVLMKWGIRFRLYDTMQRRVDR